MYMKGLEIYSANLGINVGAHLSFLVVITCGDISSGGGTGYASSLQI